MALGNDLTQILRGPVEIKKDGTAIAWTDDSNKVVWNRGLAPERPDALPAPTNYFVGAQGIEISGNLLQYSADILEFLMPELTREGDVIFFGQSPGNEVVQDYVFECVLHPLRMGASTEQDVKIYLAAVVVDPLEIEYAAEKTRKLPYKIVGTPDTTKEDGKMLGSIGETADAAAPTRDTSYPIDVAVDIAIDVSPYVIFDKGMSRSAMCDSNGNPRGMHLYDITNGANVPCVVTFATDTLPDDKVILTPVVSLENSAEHALLVDTSAFSKGGGQHAGSETTFTTIAA